MLRILLISTLAGPVVTVMLLWLYGWLKYRQATARREQYRREDEARLQTLATTPMHVSKITHFSAYGVHVHMKPAPKEWVQ